MDALTTIEGQLGFTVPPTYRAFAERGYLTHPGPDYLPVHDAAWVPLAKMPDQLSIPCAHTLRPGLVAFARSGGRGLWCWQTLRKGEAGEYPIASCPRDSDWGSWHSPSLVGWLYRTCLESVAPTWLDEPETKQRLRRSVGVIREFGRPDWAADLEAIAARPAEPLSDGPVDVSVRALLTAAEVNDRVHRAFGAEFSSGVEFPYDVNGGPEAG
jgi:hypothetical protein